MSAHLQAKVSFDASCSTWYCEVIDLLTLGNENGRFDAIAQGNGPDPLSAAMNCAEQAVAQLLANVDSEFASVLADDGWHQIDSNGMRVRAEVAS